MTNNKLVTLYDLFFSDIISCLSSSKNKDLCCGDNCPLAHINDSYNEAYNNTIIFSNKYYNIILNSKQLFKEWNHFKYLEYIKDSAILNTHNINDSTILNTHNINDSTILNTKNIKNSILNIEYLKNKINIIYNIAFDNLKESNNNLKESNNNLK